MQKLTNKEEEIMIILWRLKKAFVKEIMAEIKGSKPHYKYTFDHRAKSRGKKVRRLRSIWKHP